MHVRRDGRSSAQRSGLTLVELVMSAGLSTIVVGAAMSLMWSVSRESSLTTSDQETASRGRLLIRRLEGLIRGSRTVAVDSTTQLTLWARDDYPTAGVGGVPGDDQAQVSEIETIKYDAATKRVTRTFADFSGLSGATLAALNSTQNIPGAGAVNLGSILSGASLAPYARSEVLAEGVASFAFYGVNKGGKAVIVIADFSVAFGTSMHTFHRTIQLAAPAYFVTNSSASSTDGGPSFRLRQKAAWSW